MLKSPHKPHWHTCVRTGRVLPRLLPRMVLTVEHLADKLGLSRATVQRRLPEWEQTGLRVRVERVAGGTKVQQVVHEDDWHAWLDRGVSEAA
jgi:DeoR/GlpR family transcriptional regulator of sugar metabolism